MALPRVLVFIPAYNEEENIEQVIFNLTHVAPHYDYVIVNDGSRDNTAQICNRCGFNVIDLPFNMGLTCGFQTAVRYAYQNNYDALIQFDSDGQHDANYLDALVAQLHEHDVVIGSRFVTQKKQKSARMLGSNIISAMIKLTCGIKILDPTSGMRAFNRTCMEVFINDPTLGPEPDALALLIKRHNARVCEVPVVMHERAGGTSYLNVGNAIKYMMRTSFSILFIQAFR